jgi:hypothetical protein
MTRIDVLFNGAGATYNVNDSVEEVNKKLYPVEMGNEDFMVFDNALKNGIYQIKKLIISPNNCAVIEIIEELK